MTITTKCSITLFVEQTNKEMHVHSLYKDMKWWDGQLARLQSFYFNALLLELAWRGEGKGGIRESAFTPH